MIAHGIFSDFVVRGGALKKSMKEYLYKTQLASHKAEHSEASDARNAVQCADIKSIKVNIRVGMKGKTAVKCPISKGSRIFVVMW